MIPLLKMNRPTPTSIRPERREILQFPLDVVVKLSLTKSECLRLGQLPREALEVNRQYAQGGDETDDRPTDGDVVGMAGWDLNERCEMELRLKLFDSCCEGDDEKCKHDMPDCIAQHSQVQHETGTYH